jgi:hypothetical protein
VANPRDPTEKQYVVEFAGTRAAYLKGYYNPHHVAFGWPYISWDVRAYAKHTIDSNKRVYVHGFYAHEELRKLIVAMEGAYGASNIFNTYINDNLARFQLGIQAGKDPQKIEKEWSMGLMESLGYKHVEAFGLPKGVGGK